MQNFFDHFFALGGLLVPIVAIVVGGVMGIIKTRAQGRSDMAVVGARIKARLSGP